MIDTAVIVIKFGAKAGSQLAYLSIKTGCRGNGWRGSPLKLTN